MDCVDYGKLLIHNKEVIDSTLKLKNDTLALAAAAIFTQRDIEMSKEKFAATWNALNARGGGLASVRKESIVSLLCHMTMSDDPLKYLHAIETAYNCFTYGKFQVTEIRILAAIIVNDYAAEGNYMKYCYDSYLIYDKIKKVHKRVATEKDMPYASLIAVTDIDSNKMLMDLDKCNYAGKSFFRDSAARMMLARVLAFGVNPPEESVRNTHALWTALKNAKYKYSAGNKIAILGALTSLGKSTDELVAEFIKADDFLKTQKCFGPFKVDTEERRMYAALMVLYAHQPENSYDFKSLDEGDKQLAIQIQMCNIIAQTMCSMNTFH